MPAMTTTGRPRGARRTLGLASGSVAGGLLAYVFFALVTRALGPVQAAPVSVLWVWWGFAGAAVTFPLQHWITRTATAHGGERVLRRQRGAVVAAVLAPAVASGVLAQLLREPLFGRAGVAFPLLVAAVTAGSGLLGVLRGTLGARGRFAAVGASLAAENSLRCLAAALLYAADVRDPVAYGGCLVAGYLAAGLWPAALRFRDVGSVPAGGATLALAGGVGLGQLLAQLVLTGGPLLLAVAGGAPAAVTALFAGLALFRAPYTLAVGLVPALTGRLTGLVVAGRAATLIRLRRSVLGGTAVTALVAAALGGWLGPPLLELVFGAGVRLDGGLAALLAAGTVCAMGNLVLTIVLVARGRARGLVRGWLLGLVPGAVLFTASGQPPIDRTCWAFLVVEATVLLWLVAEDALAARDRRRRSARSAGGQEHR